MTAPGRDPSELRDPALDRAWRAASQEAPPLALDAAILAAAHRAVDTKPEAAAAARAPWRWWMPLAAAATIGAIAIGVLQLAPEERDAPTSTVSDAPSGAVVARREAPASPPPADSAAVATKQKADSPAVGATRDAERAAASVKERDSPAAAPVIAAKSSLAANPSAPAPAARQAESAATEDARKVQGTSNAQLASARGAAAPVPAETAAAGAVRPQVVAPAPNPFPAGNVASAPVAPAAPAAPLRERAESAIAQAPATPAAAGTGVPPPQALPEAKRADTPLAPDRAAEQQGAPKGVAPPAPAVMAAPPAPMPATRAKEEPARGNAPGGNFAAKDTSAPAAPVRATPAVTPRSTTANEPQALAKVLADKSRTPDDYIAAIRRLLAAGETDAARRELVAFRSVYADADARLPAELRGFAAGVAK